MFKNVKLINYKTHHLTEVHLSPITLLIGNNSSGKTNLMSGIQHFANLVRRGNPSPNRENKPIRSGDYFPLKYRLAKESEPMSMSITWQSSNNIIDYKMELYLCREMPGNVACKESLSIQGESDDKSKNINFGFEQPTQNVGLRIHIGQSSAFTQDDKDLIGRFFRDFSSTFSYHFQPSYLRNSQISISVDSKDIRIPTHLGYEGNNLNAMILYVKQYEERVFSRFLTLMRRFQPSFQGVRLDKERQGGCLIWEFDLGRDKSDSQLLVDEFTSDSVSDGFLKAAALALLVSLQWPPSLILIEEIENGVNPGNIQEIMDWLWKAALSSDNTATPQFILTSHSPSVLREFHEHLDCVYTTRLQKKGWKSDVRNLSQALDTLIGIGTVEGDSIPDQESGLFKIQIPKYQLAELWYSGTIG
jgi:predicted ATPase